MPNPPTPWTSEAVFSQEHLRATHAQRAGNEAPMDAITSRMEALETAGQEFYPGSPGGIELDYFNTSESLTDWAESEQEARTPVRHEERLCGCRIGFNAAGAPVTIDPECGPMQRCRDQGWQARRTPSSSHLRIDVSVYGLPVVGESGSSAATSPW